MDEKLLPPPKPRRFNAVGFCLTSVRIWQWSSSFFVYASFSLLYGHIQRNRLGEHERMKGIQILGLVALVYSTTVVCCVHIFKTLDIRIWRVFAIMSLPGDLTMMGICLAMITVLSFSGLPADCHGLTRDNYEGGDLVRLPADGFTTIRFGTWSHDISGELDELCTFPRTVYGLSVAAIFSYTFSVLLTVLYFQQQDPVAYDSVRTSDEESRPSMQIASMAPAFSRRPSLDSSNSSNSSHHSLSRSSSPPQGSTHSSRASIRSAAPSYHSRVSHRQSDWAEVDLRGGGPSGSSSSGSRGPNASRITSRTLSVSSQTCSTWGVTTTTTTLAGSDADSIHSGISLPVSELTASGGPSSCPLPPSLSPLSGSSAHDHNHREPPQRRWSNSTNSSYNASAFIVTDGFRPGAEPPLYSSRPGSLYHEPMKYEAGLGFPNCSPSL